MTVDLDGHDGGAISWWTPTAAERRCTHATTDSLMIQDENRDRTRPPDLDPEHIPAVYTFIDPEDWTAGNFDRVQTYWDCH
ncbi:hypothetical protein [Nocardia jinanensis]|uniref:Uncharacterized protein n=1 Tax=Nocardia jinanensis TaxID=382504 RepID=A0A917RBH5_9NOCA|nr:hypothetical protein [Nocardia jinanensis]GGK98541.1 hypothetical protein GCM10011588_11410 [Nocardia jinanensis]